MKKIRIAILATIFAAVVYSANWLFSPDPSYRWETDILPPRIAVIIEYYEDGRDYYWDNPFEYGWIWFRDEMGWATTWEDEYVADYFEY